MKIERINGIRRYTMQHPKKAAEIQICQDGRGWAWRTVGENESGKWSYGFYRTKKDALEDALK